MLNQDSSQYLTIAMVEIQINIKHPGKFLSEGKNGHNNVIQVTES